jgi:hypothetical protein
MKSTTIQWHTAIKNQRHTPHQALVKRIHFEG